MRKLLRQFSCSSVCHDTAYTLMRHLCVHLSRCVRCSKRMLNAKIAPAVLVFKCLPRYSLHINETPLCTPLAVCKMFKTNAECENCSGSSRVQVFAAIQLTH